MKAKALIICGIIILSCLGIKAQKISEEEVPQDVFISFKYKYPDATVNTWEKKTGDLYTAKFKMNDQEALAEFTKAGKWNITRYFIKEKELPSNILDYYKMNYRDKDYNISVSEMHKNNAGETFYYLMLKQSGLAGTQPVELFFDLSGNLLRKNDPNEEKANNLQNNQNVQNQNNNPVNNQTKTQNNPVNTNNAVTDPLLEKVDPAKVPDVAKKHFASKNKKASGTEWFLKEKKKYIVKFSMAGRAAQSVYTKEGVWEESRYDKGEESPHPLIENYLKDNYRSYKIKKVEYVAQPKDKAFVLQIYDKRSKVSPPPITEITFESNGKFRNVVKPDVTDPADLDAEKRKQEKDKEFMTDVDNKGVRYEDSDNYNDKIDKKELPTPIIQYVKDNYPEHKIKVTRLISDDKLGNVYLVGVKLEGSKYTTDLYFRLDGTLIRKVDETEKKAENESGSGKGSGNQDNFRLENDNNDEPSKYGTPDERVTAGELPSDITKYLKKDYPEHNIMESYFKTDKKFGNCYLLILKRVGENKVTKAWFDLDGNVLKTEVENL